MRLLKSSFVLLALGVATVAGGVATASAAGGAPVRVIRVPGATGWLAVDGGAAFVLRRTGHTAAVVRVDLASGARTVAFRTDGNVDEEAQADGGVLAFGVGLLGEPPHRQAIAIPTTPGGKPAVLRDTVSAGGDGATCARVAVDDVTPAGEVLLSTFSSPCAEPKAGTDTVSLVAPTGERTVMASPMDLSDRPLGNLVSPALAAGPWALVTPDEQHVRLFDAAAGTTRTFAPTLRSARLWPTDLQPDGRFILSEMLYRRDGGFVQRARLMAPGDPARGGRIIGTVGTPPRLNAMFCGGRLVVLQTRARRTRILVDEREVARLATPTDPRFACDATHVVVEAGGAATRYGVVALPPARLHQ
ncbi:MAG TPA: hypothetical protein VGM33_03490 [Baekduia sp.]|jgi:hypothetical protein